MPVDGPQYPINLVIGTRPVLVVGAGPVAVGKVVGLLEGGAQDVTVVAPEVDPRMDELPVRLQRRPYESPEAARYRLVVTATGVPAVDAQVFADADGAGVWVNSADDPAHCTFTLPARVRRGDLLLTVATGGRSPAVAKWLRRRFETEYGPEYDALIELLAAERERITASGGSTEGLRWQEALDSGLLELLRNHQTAEARKLLRTCLSSSSD